MLDKLWWKIAYRTTRQYNVVKIKTLAPGYYDTDTRIMHAMMQLLVDHIEIGLSGAQLMRKHAYIGLKEWLWLILPQSIAPTCLVRSSSRGLDFLRWEKELDAAHLPAEQRCPGQAHAAREMEEIYLWWKFRRPKRPDVDVVVGLPEILKKVDAIRAKTRVWGFDALPKELDDELTKALDDANKLEAAHLQEDVNMMVRLVNILPHLWI